jgi:hypothetical protein
MCLGAGIMGSVIYLSRNINNKNNALGYAAHASFGGKKFLRINTQFTAYRPIQIDPTWQNIRAYTIECNLDFISRFDDGKSFLYPFLGFSYNIFTGYFTGLNDFQNLRQYYTPQSNIRTDWFGLNAGCGFEHVFGKVIVFIDYRMRVGRELNGYFNIMDVCYGAGLKVKLLTPSLRRLFKPLHSRYDLK